MNRQAAAEAYRTASIENAPPVKIVRLLFEGALRFVARAREADPKDPNSEFIEFCSRTDAIVTELRLSINHELNDEVTVNLERLYLFCEEQLGVAMADRDGAPLDGVQKVLERLLEGWREVELESTRTAA